MGGQFGAFRWGATMLMWADTKVTLRAATHNTVYFLTTARENFLDLLMNIQFTEVKKVLFQISLFYDGPEPPAGLYDELLDLSSTKVSIFKGNFTDFVSSQFLPLYGRWI